MNKEQIYDEQIYPLMDKIISICKEHGIAMFASFSIPTDEQPDLECMTHLPDGDGVFDERFTKAQRRRIENHDGDSLR